MRGSAAAAWLAVLAVDVGAGCRGRGNAGGRWAAVGGLLQMVPAAGAMRTQKQGHACCISSPFTTWALAGWNRSSRRQPGKWCNGPKAQKQQQPAGLTVHHLGLEGVEAQQLLRFLLNLRAAGREAQWQGSGPVGALQGLQPGC